MTQTGKTPERPSDDGSPLGRRERSKLHKEEAIREAARSLFKKQGYEGTTLREVANRADVGFGTVFSYAGDKAGLLAMVFVEELKRLPPLFPAAAAGEPLDELVDGLGRLYDFWATIPSLASHVLRQMEFFSDNPHLDVIISRRLEAKQEVATWLRSLSNQGRIGKVANIDIAAETLFAIYTSAVREWSATGSEDASEGRARLRVLLELPMLGLSVRSAPRLKTGV